MSAKRKIRVEVGGLRVTIYKWSHPKSGKKGWRFGYKNAPPPWRQAKGVKWQYLFRDTQAECEEAAREKLASLQSPLLDWNSLSPERREFLTKIHAAVREGEEGAVLASIEDRHKSADIAAAVALFINFKVTAKGHTTDHLDQVKRDLEDFANHFAGRSVAEIQLGPMSAWWDARTGDAGRHRRKGIRGTLVSFYNWAQREGMTGPDAITTAERLPPLTVGGGSLYIYDPREMAVLLHHVRREFLPCIVFGAFCGMRPEEVAPKVPAPTKKRPNPPPGKPGLCWEHIDWEFNAIRLPKEVAKGGKRARVIHLQPVVLEWFKEMGVDKTWTGRVCLEDAATAGETLRLGGILDKWFQRSLGWPDDALRHSYASYRNAVIRHLSKVAEEMGNSEAMLHGHYHNPRTTEEGEAHFALTPKRCSDLIREMQKTAADEGRKLIA